jgi:hypothetical protein
MRICRSFDEVLPDLFFDRLLEAVRGYPTVAAKDPADRRLTFGLLRPRSGLSRVTHRFFAPFGPHSALKPRIFSALGRFATAP